MFVPLHKHNFGSKFEIKDSAERNDLSHSMTTKNNDVAKKNHFDGSTVLRYRSRGESHSPVSPAHIGEAKIATPSELIEIVLALSCTSLSRPDFVSRVLPMFVMTHVLYHAYLLSSNSISASSFQSSSPLLSLSRKSRSLNMFSRGR